MRESCCDVLCSLRTYLEFLDFWLSWYFENTTTSTRTWTKDGGISRRNQQSYINKRSNRPNRLSSTHIYTADIHVIQYLERERTYFFHYLERRFEFICKEIDFRRFHLNMPTSKQYNASSPKLQQSILYLKCMFTKEVVWLLRSGTLWMEKKCSANITKETMKE
jgi:hypothetical protein